MIINTAASRSRRLSTKRKQNRRPSDPLIWKIVWTLSLSYGSILNFPDIASYQRTTRKVNNGYHGLCLCFTSPEHRWRPRHFTYKCWGGKRASITKTLLPQNWRDQDQNGRLEGGFATLHNVANHTNCHLLKQGREGGGNKSYQMHTAEDKS